MQALAVLLLAAATFIALSPLGTTLFLPEGPVAVAIVPVSALPETLLEAPIPPARRIFGLAAWPSFGPPRELTAIAEGPFFGDIRGVIGPLGHVPVRPRPEELPSRQAAGGAGAAPTLYERVIDDVIAEVELASGGLARGMALTLASLSSGSGEVPGGIFRSATVPACVYCDTDMPELPSKQDVREFFGTLFPY